MTAHATQQEILLITGTSFSTRELADQNNNEGYKNQTEREKLAEACWNGLLPELLPEIFGQKDGHSLFLWQIKEADAFLELEMSEFPEKTDHYYSIDPYLFLQEKPLN